MQIRQIAALTMAITATPFAFADTLLPDPKAVFHAPSQIGGGGPPESEITSTLFSFISPTGTSPGTSPCVIGGVNDDVCDFLNLSGQDWTKLVFTASPGGDLSSCQPLVGFTNCEVNQQGGPNIPTVFTFFGGPGIPNGVAFGFSTEGWEANTRFDVVANAPEPAKLAFLVFGLLIAWLRMKPAAP
jgi:hypothetical protein